MKKLLKRFNQLNAILRRTDDEEKKAKIEDKIDDLAQEIFKALGYDEDFRGFSSEESYKIDELFEAHGLTCNYNWGLGNGDWC